MSDEKYVPQGEEQQEEEILTEADLEEVAGGQGTTKPRNPFPGGEVTSEGEGQSFREPYTPASLLKF